MAVARPRAMSLIYPQKQRVLGAARVCNTNEMPVHRALSRRLRLPKSIQLYRRGGSAAIHPSSLEASNHLERLATGAAALPPKG